MKKVIATYDMSEDAMGLGGFIEQHLANLDSPVVCVEHTDGSQCVKAELVANTLSDGSVTHDLVLTFD